MGKINKILIVCIGLLLLITPAFAANVCDGVGGVNSNATDLITCGVGMAFGSDYTFFALAVLALILGISYFFRIPSAFALAIGFAMTYTLNGLAGGSIQLLMIMALLLIGMAWKIGSSIFIAASGQGN